jgi:Ca2+-binding RTX toxin-like protein
MVQTTCWWAVQEDDVLNGGAGNNLLQGGAGADALIYGGGIDFMNGGADADTVDFSGMGAAVWVNLNYVGGAAQTMDLPTFVGGTARDIASLYQVENVVGTPYADQLTGNGADNMLVGGAGNDVLNGGAGNNLLQGGAGNDTLVYGGGIDFMNGGTEVDTADFSAFGSAVSVNLNYVGGRGTDDGPANVLGRASLETSRRCNLVENVVGTAYADQLAGNGADNTLNGGAGNNLLQGGAGNDTLVYGGGIDFMNGGTEVDTVDFSAFGSAVWVNLNYVGGAAQTMDQPTFSGGVARDIASLYQVENVVGTAYADQLTGNGADNMLVGGAGNDQLDGGAGFDFVSYASAISGGNRGSGRGQCERRCW